MHSQKLNVPVIAWVVLLCCAATEILAKGDGWPPSGGAHQKGGGGAPLGGWDDEVEGRSYGSSIPGIPGRSYPNHHKIPDTKFDCRDQKDPGYYGDTEAQCQVFHVCQEGGRSNSFLCPVGTIFNQQTFVCDWWFNVNCGDTPTHYTRNAHLHRGSDIGIDGQKIRPQGNAKGGPAMEHNQVGIPGEGNRNYQQGPNRPSVGDPSWGNQDNVNPPGRNWNHQQNTKGGSVMDHQGGMPSWGPQSNRDQQQGPNRPPAGDSWGLQGNAKGGSAMDHQGGMPNWGPQGNRNQQQGPRRPPIGDSSRGIQGNTKGGSAMNHQGRVPEWGPQGNRNQQQGPNRPPVGDVSWRVNEKGGQNRMGAPAGNRRPGGNTGNSWMNRNPGVQQNGDKGFHRRQRGQEGMGNRNGMGRMGGNAHAPNQKGIGKNALNQRRGNRRHNGGRNGDVPNQKGVGNGNVQLDRGMRDRVRQGQQGQKGGLGMDALPNPDRRSEQNPGKGSPAFQGTNGGIHQKEGFGNRNVDGGNAFPANHKVGQKGQQQLGRDAIPSNEGSGDVNLPGRNDFPPNYRRGKKGQQQFGNNAWNDEGSGNMNHYDGDAFPPNQRGTQKGQYNGNGKIENDVYTNEGPVDVNFQDQNDFSPNNRGQQQGGNGGGRTGNNKGPWSTRFESNRWSMNSRHFQHSSNHQKGVNHVDPSFDGNQDRPTQKEGFERHWDQSPGNVLKDGIQTGFRRISEGVGDFAYDYPEGNSQQFKEYATYDGKADYNDYSYSWNS